MITQRLDRPPEGPLDRWAHAIVHGDYLGAAAMLAPGDREPWLQQTQQFHRQHGGPPTYQRGDELPIPAMPAVRIARVKLIWRDATQFCLRVTITEDNQISLVEGYHPCREPVDSSIGATEVPFTSRDLP